MEHNAFQHGDCRDKTAETRDKGNEESSKSLYAQLDSDRAGTLAFAKKTSAEENSAPGGYGIIPPLMLEALARNNGDKSSFAYTLQKTLEMQNNPQLLEPREGENFHGAREVYDAKTMERLPGFKARFEGEYPRFEKEIDDAYDFTGIVRDFYQKEYNRNSIDGEGMKFISTVNFGQQYENAFWNGSQMAYGRPGPDSPFKSFMLLDVTAHEITHGVTDKEGGLNYYGQSGALNESMSDVFGQLVKQYAKKQNAGDASWLVGEGIFKDGIKGKAVRDMLHPGTAYNDPKIGKDVQPDNMTNYIATTRDRGGVHFNSGIPNRAFALFAQAVGGHAWDDPGHIWYEARKNSGSNPCFASFAYQTIEAAKKVGHKPEEADQLQKAWATVGVTPDAKAVDTSTPKGFSVDNPDALQLSKAG